MVVDSINQEEVTILNFKVHRAKIDRSTGASRQIHNHSMRYIFF